MALSPLPLTRVDDITHVIQLAVAPVFLLTAVGTLLMVLTSRLGRAVDRKRVLDKLLASLAAVTGEEAGERRLVLAELSLVVRRIHLIYRAIVLAVLCALLISLVIVVAFVDAFLAANLSNGLGVLFILALLALIASLLVFLREIFLGVSTSQLARR
jgi:hypothetical protein